MQLQVSSFEHPPLSEQYVVGISQNIRDRIIIKRILARQLRMVGLILSLLIWHICHKHVSASSWCICILYTCHKVGGLSENAITESIQLHGWLIFLSLHSLTSLATYIIYCFSIYANTQSALQASLQTLTLLLPDVITSVAGWIKSRHSGSRFYCPRANSVVPSGEPNRELRGSTIQSV